MSSHPHEQGPTALAARGVIAALVALLVIAVGFAIYALWPKTDPREVLQAMARTYAGARDLTAEASVRHQVTSNRGNQERSFEVQLKFVRPRLLLATWKGTGLDATYAVNEAGAFVVYNDVDQGRREAAPEDVLGWYAKAVELQDDPTELSWLLRGDDPTARAVAVRLVRGETEDKDAPSVVVAEITRRSGTRVRYWVNPETHLLRKVETIRRTEEGERKSGEVTTVAFRTMQLDTGLEPTTLAFQPSEEVSLAELEPHRAPPPIEQPEQPPPSAGTGPVAPEIALPDLSGNIRRLSELRGKPALLVFWASWCPPCRMELPSVQNLWQHHSSEIGIYAVSLDYELKDARRFLKKNRYTFPVVWSEPSGPELQRVAEDYNVTGIPASFVLDAKGAIVENFVGVADEEDVLAALRKAGATF